MSILRWGVKIIEAAKEITAISTDYAVTTCTMHIAILTCNNGREYAACIAIYTEQITKGYNYTLKIK